MKTNDSLLIAGTLAYSLLFYQQQAGLNFLVFDAVFIALVLIRNRGLLFQRHWLTGAFALLASGLGIALHGSNLAVFSNVLSLLVFSGLSFSTGTSAIFAGLFSAFSVLTAPVFSILDGIKRHEESGSVSIFKQGYKIYAVLTVLVLALVFFFLYKAANPLFAENTKWINLDFISWGWVVFTLGGFIVVYGLLYHKQVLHIRQWEDAQQGFLSAAEGENETRILFERYAGLLLFGMLNLMLLVLNAGDISSIWFGGQLPKGISHSDFVHQGVGVVIFSILLAVSLVVYLYRADFSQQRNSRGLKWLVYGWILQNVVMLYSTACRNNLYVADYNLTYKRLGVYAWLLLAVVGLAILFWQLTTKRNAWYLAKTNFVCWQLVLAMAALVNWDKEITTFNLKNQPLNRVDLIYLADLSDANLPQLLEVLKSEAFKKLDKQTAGRYQGYYVDSYKSDFREGVLRKIKHHVEHRNTDWRSYTLRDAQIEAALFSKPKQ